MSGALAILRIVIDRRWQTRRGTGPDSYLQNLQFLLMLQAEASKGTGRSWPTQPIWTSVPTDYAVTNAVGAEWCRAVGIPRDVETGAGSSLTGG
ncbi:hypothetical protein ACU4GD_29715, partial [Cupriavidus basilensis]